MTESKKAKNQYRVGIDVGGTFTHAVAIDPNEGTLVGRVKVPTTHSAKEGVALGIIQSLQKLLQEAGLSPENVGFIAHSTTQATNALLEGDVVPVGIIGLGSGMNSPFIKSSTTLKNIELTPGKFLVTHSLFIDTAKEITRKQIVAAVESLKAKGAKAIVVSEAFSVDDATNEKKAIEFVRELNIPATAGSEVSQLYGLKVRTRTAAINAAMLPKMMESAEMTERGVRESGIKAPVMIMRSDGGVMDIDTMRKRPILTLLSGPAAGVAAATMFLRIVDGVFLEVGGTSTDISAVSNGMAKIRGAEIGGHQIYMRTLDVRTVGIAGGSLPRIKNNQIHDVGPRSAHIAGLKYSSFAPDLKADQLSVKLIKPMDGDPDDYLSLDAKDSEINYCITPTCASNLLGLVPENDCAYGIKSSIDSGFKVLSEQLQTTKEEAATRLLDISVRKCIPVVKALIKDHKLDPELVTLVGGGGGAAAIVPHLAKTMGLNFKLAQNADVISAIGVALALIRETVERQVVNPTNEDILRIRHDAIESVSQMGADPDSIEVQVEIDPRTNVVRAIACGSNKAVVDDNEGKHDATDEEKLTQVASTLRVTKEQIKLELDGANFRIYAANKFEAQVFGLFRRNLKSTVVMDRKGQIRLQFRNAVFEATSKAGALAVVESLLEKNAEWGDAGKVIPDAVLLAGPKIINLMGLLNTSQVVSFAQAELEMIPETAQIVVIAKLG
ncbi:MAG: hydantoinase/oxoprolinase family protein [Cyanobacteria bacterium TGS_CYA1]|nr:hydantoinase/oxoprolinase family protein [Cyanobacteria bacterium TGS_CYA1]